MKQKRTVAFSAQSSNVFFHILTKCNLSCSHCYVNRDEHGRNTLSLAIIEKWLGHFAEKGRHPNVIFLGGEPTLHPDLAKAVKHARRLGYGSITIDTNGYLFHDILSRVTPEEVDFFSFSLDGATRETNDAIRGDGSYDTCIEGIGEAVKRGFSTSLIYTVSSRNIHELEMMPSLLKRLSIDRFFIQVVGIRGKSARGNHDGIQVSKESWIKIIPRVADAVAREGIVVTYPKVFLEAGESFECAGLVADNYFVFPNGRVYRCPLCEDFPLHAMEMKEDKLTQRGRLTESDLFGLTIPEGCVMNKLIQPDNLRYNKDGTPEYKIACCLLKEEITQV
jgi:Fe-coproporphyrin III synthase